MKLRGQKSGQQCVRQEDQIAANTHKEGHDMPCAGGGDKLDYYLHASRLGAGTEALLGFVEAALGNGQGREAGTFAAACRSASLAVNDCNSRLLGE